MKSAANLADDPALRDTQDLGPDAVKENSRVTKYKLQLGRTHFTVSLH